MNQRLETCQCQPQSDRVSNWQSNFFKRKHYYTNDFVRRCPFINGGGHKIQLPRLIPTINGGGHFLFIEADSFARLGKWIYGGGHPKATASKNNLFLKAVVLRYPPL